MGAELLYTTWTGATSATQELESRREFEMLERTKRSVVTVGLLKDIYSPGTKTTAETFIGHASGFFVSDGLIMTSAHVAAAATLGARFVVALNDGKVANANVVYVDPRHDVALLRPNFEVGAEVPPALELADPKSLQIGQEIWSIGTPLSPFLPNRHTSGIITKVPQALTGTERPEEAAVKTKMESTLQTMPGMSGGPIVNEYGQVVAITTGGYYSPGRPEAGTWTADVGVGSFELIAKHPEFFASVFTMAVGVDILKNRNNLPEGLAGKGPLATAALAFAFVEKTLSEYFSRKNLPIEEQTLLRAQLLTSESTQMLLKASIGQLIFKEEMIAINSEASARFGLSLYSGAEIASAPSQSQFPERIQKE